MAAEAHRVVQDSHDLDELWLDDPVDDKMTSPPPAARDVQRPKSWENLIATEASRNVWPA